MIKKFNLFEAKKKGKLDKNFIGCVAILEDPAYAEYKNGRFYHSFEDEGFTFIVGSQKFYDGIWLISEEVDKDIDDKLSYWYNSEKFKIIETSRKSSENDPYGEEMWEINEAKNLFDSESSKYTLNPDNCVYLTELNVKYNSDKNKMLEELNERFAEKWIIIGTFSPTGGQIFILKTIKIEISNRDDFPDEGFIVTTRKYISETSETIVNRGYNVKLGLYISTDVITEINMKEPKRNFTIEDPFGEEEWDD